MSSDRNKRVLTLVVLNSLVDWDMSSDRNVGNVTKIPRVSLVDWDMSSDRNLSRFLGAHERV